MLQSFRAESAAWSVDVEGGLLRGRTLGRGRPLYFLNGISGNCELFCLLAWLLRDDFRCVLFDYRNGDSKRLTSGQLVDDLLAVADAQRDHTFSIFAAPFGSLVALSALAKQPDRIERAILLGGFAHRHLSLFERLLCGFGYLSIRRLVPGPAAEHAAARQPPAWLSAVRRQPLGFLRPEYEPNAHSRPGRACLADGAF